MKVNKFDQTFGYYLEDIYGQRGLLSIVSMIIWNLMK